MSDHIQRLREAEQRAELRSSTIERDAIRDPALIAAVLAELSQMFPLMPLVYDDDIAAILRRVKEEKE